MMPKGVEHQATIASESLGQRSEVRIPMMPKGVEHIINAIDVDGNRLVRIPMMPKGVEHC